VAHDHLDEPFWRSGLAVLQDFVPQEECSRLLARLASYCAEQEPPRIERAHGDRPLRYQVIDGLRMPEALPGLHDLYSQVGGTLSQLAGRPLVPFTSRAVARNVNITPPGGSYRWHYDRNAVTGVLYLNAVAGGETDICPQYRLALPGPLRRGVLQGSVDRLLQARPVRSRFGRQRSVVPAPGTLVVMRGDRCLHSVRMVGPGPDRVCIVMSYELADAHAGSAGDDRELDDYLYRMSEQMEFRIVSPELTVKALRERSPRARRHQWSARPTQRRGETRGSDW